MNSVALGAFVGYLILATLVQLLALVVGLARIVLLYTAPLGKHAQKSYEAVAHLLVGALLGAMVFGGPHWCAVCFWLLCAVEVVCGVVVPLLRKYLI